MQPGVSAACQLTAWVAVGHPSASCAGQAERAAESIGEDTESWLTPSPVPMRRFRRRLRGLGQWQANFVLLSYSPRGPERPLRWGSSPISPRWASPPPTWHRSPQRRPLGDRLPRERNFRTTRSCLLLPWMSRREGARTSRDGPLPTPPSVGVAMPIRHAHPARTARGGAVIHPPVTKTLAARRRPPATHTRPRCPAASEPKNTKPPKLK